MQRLIRWSMVLIAACLFTACSEEKPPAPPAPPPPPAAPATGAPTAVEAAKQAAEAVREKAAETAAVAKAEAGRVVDAVKDQAAEVKQKMPTTVEQAKTVVTEKVDKIKQEAAAVVAATAKPAKAPAEVVYEAANGNVTFNHVTHAKSLACVKCHPGDTPGPIPMTKEVGHGLCKDCHQAVGGKAPTSCAGCHIKP